MRDEGFEFPDVRRTFFTKDEAKVEVLIVRHWQYREEYDDYPDFKVSFDLRHTDAVGRVQLINLPLGTDQSKAETVAHTLWEEDEEATSSNDETEAIYAAERRMGA